MASDFGTESAPETPDPTVTTPPPVSAGSAAGAGTAGLIGCRGVPSASVVHRFRLLHETSLDGGETWISSHAHDYVEAARIAEFVAGIVAAL